MYKILFLLFLLHSTFPVFSVQTEGVPRYPRRQARQELLRDLQRGVQCIKDCMHCLTACTRVRMRNVRTAYILLTIAVNPFAPSLHLQTT